jgi:hypothetical protein
MQFEIIYAGTQPRLKEKIEKRIADGWEMRGEAMIIEPEVTTDLEVPKFVYFSQTMIREQ